ncbi:hypothetical protein [Cupriavidus necator]|uniref:hypothetical protein n=1 Tax=Cupriavidus necator TaxID=106590 RepID=UPI002F2625DD
MKPIPHETDRRITPVKITPCGQKLTSSLIEQARKHEDEVLAPLGKKLAWSGPNCECKDGPSNWQTQLDAR